MASLEEVRGPGGKFPVQCQRDKRGRPLEGRGHPFLYFVEDNGCGVTSLGRDGRPGGIGLDWNLSNLEEWPKEPVPALWLALVHPSTRGILLASLEGGVLAFLLSLAIVDPCTPKSHGVLPLALKLGFTILGAFFVAYLVIFVFPLPRASHSRPHGHSVLHPRWPYSLPVLETMVPSQITEVL